MRVSLVLATVGRTDSIRRLLESLRDQRRSVDEIVVADQNEDDRLLPWIREYSDELPILHLRAPRGLSVARNTALSVVTGDVVAFPDDDCWYDPELIDRLCDWFAANSDYGFICGSYSLPGTWNPRFPRSAGELSCFNAPPRVSSVALFVRRSIIESHQFCFDENLGAGTVLPAGEETDLVLEMLRCGVRGRYEPSLMTYHEIDRESTILPQNVLRREAAISFVLGKHASAGSLGISTRLILKLTKGWLISAFKPGLRSLWRHQIAGAIDGLRCRESKNRLPTNSNVARS